MNLYCIRPNPMYWPRFHKCNSFPLIKVKICVRLHFSCTVGLFRLCMYAMPSFVSLGDYFAVPLRLQVGLLSTSSLLLFVLWFKLRLVLIVVVFVISPRLDLAYVSTGVSLASIVGSFSKCYFR